MAKKLTSKKAKEILKDGTVHGNPLTEKQRKYFGWVAGGSKAQAGKPIYVSNPNDPILKAYQDSLALYNKTKNIENPKYYDYPKGDVFGNSFKDWKNINDFIKANNIVISSRENSTEMFPGNIKPIDYNNFTEGTMYPIYKKPVQKVEYKKAPELQRVSSTRSREMPMPDVQIGKAPNVSPKKTEYSYTYPTFDKNVQNTMYFPDEQALRTFTDKYGYTDRTFGQGAGSATGNPQYVGGGKIADNGRDLVMPQDGYRGKYQDNGLGYSTEGYNYNSAWGGAFQMGGSLSGATGMMYARTGSTYEPGNAKKKKAQAGMAFYQNGLDWKPRMISEAGDEIDPRLLAIAPTYSSSTYVKPSVLPDKEMVDKRNAANAFFANQAYMQPGSPANPEATKEKNRRYAAATGKRYNGASGAVSDRFSANTDKTLRRAQENIVEPMVAMSPMGELGAVKDLAKVGLKGASNLIEGSLPYKLGKEIQRDIYNEYVYPLKHRKTIKDIRAFHETMPQRMASPEASERLGLALGIDPANIETPFLNFSPLGRTGYIGDNALINMNLDQLKREVPDISARAAYEHEYGHHLQREAYKQTPEYASALSNYQNAVKGKSPSASSMLKGALSPQGKLPPTLLDDLLIESYGGVDPVSGIINKTIATPGAKNPVRSAKYFSKESEPLPHLREMRQDMLEKGYIKDYYEDIPVNKLKNYITNNPQNRIASFTDVSDPDVMKGLWQTMHNLPAAVPVIGVGAAAAASQRKSGGAIKDNRGQWAHPGKVTEIDSNQITMAGVPYPVFGVSDTGDSKMMMPGENYTFDGNSVTEYPMADAGLGIQDMGQLKKLDQLTNFTNYNNMRKAKKGMAVTPMMKAGGDPDGQMALGQIKAMHAYLDNLEKQIKPNSDLEPWVNSKITLANDYLNTAADYLQYGEEGQEQSEEMKAGGGIPTRYKNMGFTHVGQKKAGDGKHKWKVLAKKGDKYKVVQGGWKGMEDFSQHGSEKRRTNFWNRMGGKDSAKAKDPFSPLYWHKRLGKWEDGGAIPDNPGFNALPENVQQKIIDNMEGGGKMPAAYAKARFAAAGNEHLLGDYGYAKYGADIEPFHYYGYSDTRSNWQDPHKRLAAEAGMPLYTQSEMDSAMAGMPISMQHGGWMGPAAIGLGVGTLLSTILSKKKQNLPQRATSTMPMTGKAEDSEAAKQMARAGIHINPANKGKFTETKKRTGKTTEELTHSKNPLTRKRAIFAQNAAKWKHENGGDIPKADNGFLAPAAVGLGSGLLLSTAIRKKKEDLNQKAPIIASMLTGAGGAGAMGAGAMAARAGASVDASYNEMGGVHSMHALPGHFWPEGMDMYPLPGKAAAGGTFYELGGVHSMTHPLAGHVDMNGQELEPLTGHFDNSMRDITPLPGKADAGWVVPAAIGAGLFGIGALANRGMKNKAESMLQSAMPMMGMMQMGGELPEARSGIHIKPSKKGTFTAAAKKHGKSVQAFASQVLANKENYSPAMVKKANFARNAAGWNKGQAGLGMPQAGGFTSYEDYLGAMQQASIPTAYTGVQPMMDVQSPMYANTYSETRPMAPLGVQSVAGPQQRDLSMQKAMAPSLGIKAPPSINASPNPTQTKKKKKKDFITPILGVASAALSGALSESAPRRYNKPEDQGYYNPYPGGTGSQALFEQGGWIGESNGVEYPYNSGLMFQAGGAAANFGEDKNLDYNYRVNDPRAARSSEFKYGFEAGGEMIKRADGSYSRRGLWDNIRANRGSGKKPTKEMLEQERKIKAQAEAGMGLTGMYYPRGGEIMNVADLENPIARMGGQIRSNYAPSEYEEGGELSFYDDTQGAQPISENPYTSQMVQFDGEYHGEKNDVGSEGIPINYGGVDVEVEKGETGYRDSKGNFQILGNMKNPITGRKFKEDGKVIAKAENKANKKIQKGTDLINESDPESPYDRLKINSGKAKMMGGDEQLQNLAALRETFTDLQQQKLDMAASLGIEPMEFDKKAKYGKMIKAQGGQGIKWYHKWGIGWPDDPEDRQILKQQMRDMNTDRIQPKTNAIPIPAETTPITTQGASQQQLPFGVTRDPIREHSDLLMKSVKENDPFFMTRNAIPMGSDIVDLPEIPIVGKKKPTATTTTTGGGKSTARGKGTGTKKATASAATPEAEAPYTGLNKDYWKSRTFAAPQEPSSLTGTTEAPSYKSGSLTNPANAYLPSDVEPFDYGNIVPEIYALATNKVSPVYMQKITPELAQAHHISLQNQLNKNEATFRASSRELGNNPGAMSVLAAQKYAADQDVLDKEFQFNQQMDSNVYNANRQAIYDARLKNIAMNQEQAKMQEMARVNTQKRAFDALSSITDKKLQDKATKNALRTYENLYKYRFGKDYVAKSLNPAENWDNYNVTGIDPNTGKPYYATPTKTTTEDKSKVAKKFAGGNLIKEFKKFK